MNEIQELKKAFASISRSISGAINNLDSILALAAPIIEKSVNVIEQRLNQLERENEELKEKLNGKG